MMLAVAGIALHMLRGIRYLRDPSVVDSTLADGVKISYPILNKRTRRRQDSGYCSMSQQA